jgi:hypothetical protein
MFFLDEHELPNGFRYPGAFRRLVDRQLTRLEPWWVFDVSLARGLIRSLEQRYPGRQLVPFAKREDNDDVACFDGGRVVVLHDYASDAWERRRSFEDLYAWLRRAVEDMIELDRLEDDSA